MQFTYKSYEQLVCLCKKKNYNIVAYNDAGTYSKEVILRHDVDFAPDRALKIAKLEHDLSVTSTYFFLLRTDFYNVFSKNNQAIIKEMLNYGHDIGLHFDETFYDDCTQTNIAKYVENEVKSMSNAIGKKVKSISMHRPSKWLLDANIEFDGLVNSYSNKYFKEYKYVSDSRLNWRENVVELIESECFPKMHILTHPFSYSERIESNREKLYSFIIIANKERFQSVNENFTNLNEYIKEHEID